MKNSTGLDKKKIKVVTDKLNKLLANYQLHYQNIRGFHWNLKGNDFFTLHIKFEELFKNAQVSIDEIAERIVTLEETPYHTFSDYLENSDIKEHKNVSTSKESVSKTVADMLVLIENERDVIVSADKANDVNTSDMMTALIKFQEKTIWMLNSYNHK